ncbi:MAG: 5-oxoprolinase subunit PxpB [Woeseiaceae bacterium]|nr:5-oxoprolinase subunit PxpB [Woeseiaceae bacterium]
MPRRCADDLWSIAVESPADAQALAAELRRAGGWLDVVPGIDSVVVRFDPLAEPVDTAGARIDRIVSAGIPALVVDEALIEIPVVYGGEYGPDLEELCAATGLSRSEFIALHTGSEYTVDMVGFTPGFAFVGGLDERLRIPRRAEPRARVEPGSVGIAGGRTGLYAMASPGGWTLVGRTPYRLFDPQGDEPFALRAGMRVRFIAIDADEFDS